MTSAVSINHAEAYILLGANLGDKIATFSLARQLIAEQCGEIISESKLYESEAWGFEAPGFFLNQVVLIRTPQKPVELLSNILSIETFLGRKREQKSTYASRTIDIDLLYYGQEVIENEKLIVPHPRLHLRRFTLLPLCEIAPAFMHPGLNKNHEELLNEVVDKSEVRPIEKLSD